MYLLDKVLKVITGIDQVEINQVKSALISELDTILRRAGEMLT
jgi:hypothetical protein